MSANYRGVLDAAIADFRVRHRLPHSPLDSALLRAKALGIIVPTAKFAAHDAAPHRMKHAVAIDARRERVLATLLEKAPAPDWEALARGLTLSDMGRVFVEIYKVVGSPEWSRTMTAAQVNGACLAYLASKTDGLPVIDPKLLAGVVHLAEVVPPDAAAIWTPEAAIAYWRDVIPLAEEEVAMLLANLDSFQRETLAVAGEYTRKIMEFVTELFSETLKEGLSLESFQTAFTATLFGKTAALAETLFRTNIAKAYGAVRVEKLTSAGITSPFIQFLSIPDDRRTPVCRAMYNYIAASDDPIWQTFTPPLHWNCRSDLSPIGYLEAIRMGIAERTKDGSGLTLPDGPRPFGDPPLWVTDPKAKSLVRVMPMIGFGASNLSERAVIEIASFEYDEDQHPRTPSGSGKESGRWTEKGSGGTAGLNPYPSFLKKTPTVPFEGQHIDQYTPEQRAAIESALAKDGVTAESVRANLEAVWQRAQTQMDPAQRAAALQWYETQHAKIIAMAKHYGLPQDKMFAMVAAMSPQTEWDHQFYDPKTGEPTTYGAQKNKASQAGIKLSGTAGLTIDVKETNLLRVIPVIEAWKKNPDGDPVEMVYKNGKTGKGAVVILGTSGIAGHAVDALKILQGVPITKVLGGPKVRSFYDNLRYPAAIGPNTFDRHMGNMVAGVPDGSFVQDDKRFNRISKPKLGPAGKGIGKKATYPWFAQQITDFAKSKGITPHAAQALLWVQWRDEHDPRTAKAAWHRLTYSPDKAVRIKNEATLPWKKPPGKWKPD